MGNPKTDNGYPHRGKGGNPGLRRLRIENAYDRAARARPASHPTRRCNGPCNAITWLSWLTVWRGRYYCQDCIGGVVERDTERLWR
jgi:hypothetical protein